MELEARTTERGGTLGYGVAGSGPPVVLLHGWPETRREWRHVWPPLVAAGHRVIVPDLRGVGESDRSPSADYTWAGYADDLDAVLDAEGVGECALVGHDMGGIVMFEWALRHPARAERVVAASTCFNRYGRPYLLLLRTPGVGEAFLWACMGTRRGLAFAIRRSARHPTAFSEADLDAYFDAVGTRDSRRAVLAGYRALSRNLRRRRPVAERLRLSCPALVVWGTFEWALGNDGWRDLTADVPQARVEILDAGHFPVEEQPARFTELLREFLAPRVQDASAAPDPVRSATP